MERQDYLVLDHSSKMAATIDTLAAAARRCLIAPDEAYRVPSAS